MISASSMSSRLYRLCQQLGLSANTGFYREPLFALAIIAGFAVVGVLYLLLPAQDAVVAPASLLLVVKWLIWAPVLEELLFRGLLQGQLQQYFRSAGTIIGLSRANWITSLAFTGIHFVHHSPLWAAGVLFPSLVFGYFRDRENSVLPPIVLHAIYNAQMLFILG